MKKILLSLFTILSLCAMLRADLNDALLHFNGTTDKNPLSYEVGEPMTFTFHFGEFNAEIPAGWKIQWVRKGDDGALADGLIVWDPAVPASFETTLNTEGFVRIIGTLLDAEGNVVKVKDKQKERKVVLECGAAVHPENLHGVEEPADFDEYWAKQKALLAEVPLSYSMTKLQPTQQGLDVYAVSIACAGGRPVTGFMTIPQDAAEKSLPATVNFMGYSYNKEMFQTIPNWGRPNCIFFTINAHGADLLKDDAYYDAYGEAIKSNGFSYAFDPAQNANPDTAYFHGMVLRVLRALEFVKSLPAWNGKDLCAVGGSQGGLQTIWAAALDHDVTLANPSIPWCCDLGGAETFQRICGDWRLQYVRALDYYDCVHMARRIQCPVEILRAGLGDYTCPPSGIAVFYNNLTVPKKINWYQGSTHGYVPLDPEIFTVNKK